MTIQEAAAHIEYHLFCEALHPLNDLDAALTVFLPIIQAAAYIEREHQVPVVQPMKEPSQ